MQNSYQAPVGGYIFIPNMVVPLIRSTGNGLFENRSYSIFPGPDWTI